MARRPPATGGNIPPQQSRQNEYFVPRDGIDREVITADICRYLGNDALVRPGNYENPENGQIIQGYFINAYRNLTSAMIQDLKADSARWDQERRHQSANRSNAGGGTTASNGAYIRSSNTPPAQYRNSDIHQLRQHYGPTEASYSGTGGSDPFDNGPRYPGTGNSGYTGVASSGSYAQPYAAPQGGYVQQNYAGNPQQFAPPQGNVPSYGTGHQAPPAGYAQNPSDPPYQIVGANLRAGSQPQTDQYGNDPYGNQRDPRGDPRDQRPPVTTSMPPSRSTYAATGPSSSTQSFTTQGQNANYYPPSTTSASAPYPSAVQPGDPFYGRGGNAQFSAAPDQQYESTPAHKRTGSAQNTQLPTSGPPRHGGDRDSVERHTDPRHAAHRNRR